MPWICSEVFHCRKNIQWWLCWWTQQSWTYLCVQAWSLYFNRFVLFAFILQSHAVAEAGCRNHWSITFSCVFWHFSARLLTSFYALSITMPDSSLYKFLILFVCLFFFYRNGHIHLFKSSFIEGHGHNSVVFQDPCDYLSEYVIIEMTAKAQPVINQTFT